MGSERISDDPAKVVAQLKYWGVVVADWFEGPAPTPALKVLNRLGDVWVEYLEGKVELVRAGTYARARLLVWISHHWINHHITRLKKHAVDLWQYMRVQGVRG